MELKIGADPELFVQQRGKIVNAFGMVPGTKDYPFLLAGMRGAAVQVDGVALEFNVNPSTTDENFCHEVTSVMAALKEMIPEDAEFSDETHHTWPVGEWDRFPIEARKVGCDPDFSAYTEAPQDHRMDEFTAHRGVGGHIHIGWTKDQDVWDNQHFISCVEMTKQLDVHIGLPFMLLDKDSPRRAYQGRFGTFRPKPYGLEYRTPSNFWIHDEVLIKLVFNAATHAFNRLAVEGQEDWMSLPKLPGMEHDIARQKSAIKEAIRCGILLADYHKVLEETIKIPPCLMKGVLTCEMMKPGGIGFTYLGDYHVSDEDEEWR